MRAGEPVASHFPRGIFPKENTKGQVREGGRLPLSLRSENFLGLQEGDKLQGYSNTQRIPVSLFWPHGFCILLLEEERRQRASEFASQSTLITIEQRGAGAQILGLAAKSCRIHVAAGLGLSESQRAA